MQIERVKLVYFSPTGTTRSVLRGIAAGMNGIKVEEINLTPPDTEEQDHEDLGEELVLIGMPVYAGRLPPVAVERLQRLRGNHTPAVLVAVYGNRAFEDALVEMQDLTRTAGFIPVAAGAFIGEHSYTMPDKPLSVGRPDEADLEKAARFGAHIQAKLTAAAGMNDLPVLDVPGNHPYRELKHFADTAPETDDAMCTLCEECFRACPTGAITLNDHVHTDIAKCIVCCACIKVCPTEARVMRDKNILRITNWLYENYSARKEPEIFL